jgi:hypothetical protein
MLTDQVTQLLAAFVDGELTQRQRKAVLRLLNRSSEARELLRQLQENAHKVKQLPRRKVEPSLVPDVLQAIGELQTQPAPLPRHRRRRWAPFVVLASMAACLLLGLAGFLYWKSLAHQENPNRPDHIPFVIIPPKKTDPARTTLDRETPPLPKSTRKPNPMLNNLLDGTYQGFATIPVEQIFVASFSEINNDASTAGRLTQELNQPAVKLELKVKNNSIAMERLKTALHNHGINVIVDADAAKTLKKPQGKVEYLVYAENLSTDEVTQLLKDLSQADDTGMGSSVPSPYEKLKAIPLAKTETSQVNNVLGIDLSKPYAKASRPPKRWERHAVIFPVNAGAQPSEELRKFAKQRRRPHAGTVQLLIKIHQD